MLCNQDQAIIYHCGLGGVSPRVVPLPITCPTAFHPWWLPEERFWINQRPTRGWVPTQPTPEA